MRISKLLRYFVGLIILFLILTDVFLNYSKYFIDKEDVICELGRVESFTSSRSASNWFFLVESGERFSADSFNLSRSAPYAIWENNDYVVNDKVHTICHVEVRRFIFFESYYVIYFGDYSHYEKDDSIFDGVFESIENRTYSHFALLVFIYLIFLYFNLRD